MLKHKITYTNFNGNEVEETHYFNLTRLELMEMELGAEGGSFEDFIKRVVASEDNYKLIQEFKQFILMCYGERTEDGRHFLKEDDDGHLLSKRFAQTAAFEQLFMDFLTNGEQFVLDFVRGVVPKDIQGTVSEETKAELAKAQTTPPSPPARAS